MIRTTRAYCHDDGAEHLRRRLELVHAPVGTMEVERERRVSHQEPPDPRLLGEVY